MENQESSELIQKEALNNLWSAIATLDPEHDKTDAKIVKKITYLNQRAISTGSPSHFKDSNTTTREPETLTAQFVPQDMQLIKIIRESTCSYQDFINSNENPRLSFRDPHATGGFTRRTFSPQNDDPFKSHESIDL